MFSYTVFFQDGSEEMDFTGETKEEVLYHIRVHLQGVVEKRVQRGEGTYVKYKASHKLKYYLNEVRAYSKLAGLKVCPKLLNHGVVLECKVHDEQSRKVCRLYGYYIETEMYGCTLGSMHPELGAVYELDSRDVDVDDEFDFIFPYSEDVKKQIRNLIDKMHQAGVYHGDLHQGNIVVKDNILRFIDFELCEFRED
nr:serine/threonine kinase [Cedratvirus plubellavi]